MFKDSKIDLFWFKVQKLVYFELSLRERKKAELHKEVLRSISPTFYMQLLHVQIPKVQKDNDDLTVFLCYWDLGA